MVTKLYDFDYDEWLTRQPNWVKELPDWVQQRLANTPYLASDTDGRAEYLSDKYYRIHSRGFAYSCTPSLDWVR
jgi:hypothetical protein